MLTRDKNEDRTALGKTEHQTVLGTTNHIRILLPVSISFTSPQLACYFASCCRVLSKSDHLLRRYDVMSIFQDGGCGAQYYFRFPTFWCHCIRKVKIYQQTKFVNIINWQLIYDYFRFWKQTSAILQFYFRFRSRPFRRNLHVLLHRATEFRSDRSNRSGNMTYVISIYQDGGRDC